MTPLTTATSRATDKTAAQTVPTTAATVPEVAAATPGDEPWATSAEPETSQLAAQPASSRVEWGAAQVAGLLAFAALLSLSGVAVGRRRRQPKP